MFEEYCKNKKAGKSGFFNDKNIVLTFLFFSCGFFVKPA